MWNHHHLREFSNSEWKWRNSFSYQTEIHLFINLNFTLQLHIKNFNWRNTSSDLFWSSHRKCNVCEWDQRWPLSFIKNASTKQDNGHFQQFSNSGPVWDIAEILQSGAADTVKIKSCRRLAAHLHLLRQHVTTSFTLAVRRPSWLLT